MSRGAPTSILDLLEGRAAVTPAREAWRYRRDDVWRALTWTEVAQRTARIAGSLARLGVRPGDRVAIAAGTRVEWLLAAMGIWHTGGVLVTIYPSSTAEDVRFLLDDAGCVAIVVEDEAQLDKVRAARPRLPALRAVVLIDGEAEDATPFAALDAPPAAAAATGGDDLAALIYTSGTTGRPKGVMLTHDNFVAVCLGTAAHTPAGPDDLAYLFLPLAHVYGLAVALVALHVGTPLALDGDVDRLLQGLAEVRPTYLPAVPRVFEKVHERVLARARGAGRLRFAIFRWASAVGARHVRAAREGRVPVGLRLRHRLADRLVFRKLRAAFGGRVRALSSGGAPLAPELAEFFLAAGLPVLEGYGLTESTAVTTSNRLEALRPGTVGLPGDGVEVRVAPDGEVLIRGRTVMRGYWNRPEETAEVLVDGWLRTGDLGEIDADGFVRITDRKKHLIVTSGGKNIAPAKIENLLKARSELVAEVLVHGDRRKYCVALVALDPDALLAWADREGVAGDYAALLRHPAVRDRVARDVEAVNGELASFETLKAFHLIDSVPTVASGDLTPSLKLRREVLERRYASALEALYRRQGSPRP